MNQRIIHDCSHKGALRLLKAVAHLLREEEHRDTYDFFYCTIKETLSMYATEYDHLLRRLHGTTPN